MYNANMPLDYSTYKTANLLFKLISVRDGLCDSCAIDFTQKELLSIFENICTR